MAVAYFYTWTTYGTWLPGDPRGWYQPGRGFQTTNPMRMFEASLRMADDAVILNIAQRQLVEKTIADHCAIRKWELHAVNCRSNHVHAVVSASERVIKIPREQLKSWCTRKLNELARKCGMAMRDDYWAERGWDEYVDSDSALAEVNDYVLERQDYHPEPG